MSEADQLIPYSSPGAFLPVDYWSHRSFRMYGNFFVALQKAQFVSGLVGRLKTAAST